MDDAAFYLDSDDEQGEEQLHTSPLRLLQAVDLYVARLDNPGTTARALAALGAGAQQLSTPRLRAVLRELREDVQAYWEAAGGGGAAP